MRILLWYWGRRGGGAQFSLGLAQALSQIPGVRLQLSMSAHGELIDEFRALEVALDAVNTYSDLPGFAAGMFRLPALTRGLIASGKQADVVVSGMTHVWTPLVAPALARAGIPFVPVVHDASPHPGDFSPAWRWRLGREIGAAQAAVTLSEAVAGILATRLPALPLIRMALPAFLAGRLCNTERPAAKGLRLLFFGRVRAYKGLDLLRDAFRQIHSEHPEVSLRVVGEGDAEACAPGLGAMSGVTIENRWVAEREIPSLIKAADAVVLPYREASQSGIAPQALAMGVPVVATPVGGLPEQVRAGHGGILATAVTSSALALAIAPLLLSNELSRLRREAQLASRVAADWPGAADALLSGLHRVVHPRK
jgi:glycosyltransferase involved in cell wall biosynthesis